MSPLVSIVTAALLSLIRPSTTWAPVPRERVELIAEDIALATELHDGAPFTGPDRLRRAGLALAAVAAHESNLADKVVSCRYDGDPLRGWKPGTGRSITHFQLMRGASWGGHTKAEICGSGPLAAYLAGSVLARYARCGTPIAVFQGYAAGDCGRRVKAAARQCAMWTRAAATVGVEVSCWSRL